MVAKCTLNMQKKGRESNIENIDCEGNSFRAPFSIRHRYYIHARTGSYNDFFSTFYDESEHHNYENFSN